jgi:hypothetical protein
MKRGREMDHAFKETWKNLMSLEGKDTYWLPVDTQDREERLAVISRRLGHEFKTNWTPVGVHYGSAEYKGGMNLSDARKFFLKHKTFFDQFGYVI